MKRILSFGIVLVLLLASVGAVSANLVKNGGFETSDPQYTGDHTLLIVGDTDIAPWSIDSGSIDLINVYWQHASGSYSIDLAGNEKGTISQDLATTAGRKYDLSFMMAGNLYYTPTIKEVEVIWGGVSQGTFEFDTTGKDAIDMGWERREIMGLVATGATTKLQFVDVSSGSDIPFEYGVVLDDISVVEQTTPVPEFPSAFLPATMIIGFLGAVLLIQRTREH